MASGKDEQEKCNQLLCLQGIECIHKQIVQLDHADDKIHQELVFEFIKRNASDAAVSFIRRHSDFLEEKPFLTDSHGASLEACYSSFISLFLKNVMDPDTLDSAVERPDNILLDPLVSSHDEKYFCTASESCCKTATYHFCSNCLEQKIKLSKMSIVKINIDKLFCDGVDNFFLNV